MLLFILILCAIYPTLYYSAVHYEQKGKALIEQGRYQEALEAFDFAIKLKPRPDALGYYGKGVVLTKLGMTEEAKKAFEEAKKYKQDAEEVYGKEFSIPHKTKVDNEKLTKPVEDKKNPSPAFKSNIDAVNKQEMRNLDEDNVIYNQKKEGE